MPEPLKLGIIGGALSSAVGTTHVISSQMDRKWGLAAACFSRDAVSNRETAERWGLASENLHGSLIELLENEAARLDAVVVLTPTPSHREIVSECLNRGVPVICEKALCTSLADGIEISKLVTSQRAFLAVTFNYTGYPMLREMRARIRTGEIGNVRQVHLEMPQETYLKHGIGQDVPKPQPWRLTDPVIPSLHLDLGVHLDSIIQFLTGERAKEVVAIDGTFGRFPEVVDNAMALARYSGGIDCRMWFGKSALGHSNGLRVEVLGDMGGIEWVQLKPDQLRWSDDNGKSHIIDPRTTDLLVASQPRYNRFKPGHPMGFLEAFANYYEDLADAVTRFRRRDPEQNPWVLGVQEAVNGLAMLEAMHQSALNRRWEMVQQT